MHPKQLKIYQQKAAFLQSKGWKQKYHYNNWIHISNFDPNNPTLLITDAPFYYSGISLEEACERENYYNTEI